MGGSMTECSWFRKVPHVKSKSLKRNYERPNAKFLFLTVRSQKILVLCLGLRTPLYHMGCQIVHYWHHQSLGAYTQAITSNHKHLPAGTACRSSQKRDCHLQFSMLATAHKRTRAAVGLGRKQA